ncbi:MAG: ABC transporter substrate-binding protein [Caldilineaceae bacterium]|nr:ABC transporter substrate-binding protein [Caldilineaceae bacterium]
MIPKKLRAWSLVVTLGLGLILTACTIPIPSTEDMQSATEAAPRPELRNVPGIVDPDNTGWPRTVEGLNGSTDVAARPERIITASVGHDEMAVALVPLERLVAVGASSKDATYSNVAGLLAEKPEISRDPETIIAQDPDIIVTSPYFPAEGVEALERVAIPVVQTALEHDTEARLNNILLLGYIFGEEERAIEFAAEVQQRHANLVAVTGAKDMRPSVVALTRYSDRIWVAGSGSTEGSIIEAAGGVNAAATAGIDGHQTITLEGVIVMAPELIMITQPLAFGAEEFKQDLLNAAALAEVPAINSDRVHIVDSKLFTTLSYWNIRGAEELAHILWPDDFPNPPAEGFSQAN